MLLNYTSILEPEQTIAEIQKMLTKHGVRSIMTDYDGAQVSGVSFSMDVGGRKMAFRMPCNWRGVREVFNQTGVSRGDIKHKDKSLDNQAARTAWRIIKDWMEAQLALVEVNMVTIPQVFLPYAIMRDDRTLAEHVASNPAFLLDKGN